MTYGILLLLTAPTYAQGLETRFSLELSANVLFSRPSPPISSWGIRGSLETRYARDLWSLNLTLNPGVQFGPQVVSDSGLTEAYALYRLDDLDLSAGLERIPLEVARFSVPYSIETVGALGGRQGKLGARLVWNPENTRVRLALLEHPDGWFGLLSARREFEGFELEAHALAPSGRVVLGLGGSGTVGSLVVYGEVWALFLPTEWRYALGLSGSLGDGLWTLEGGHASPLPGQPPRRLLAAQFSNPMDEDASWSAATQIYFDPDGARGQLGLSYTQTTDAQESDYTIFLQLGPEPLSGGFRFRLKIYPGQE